MNLTSPESPKDRVGFNLYGRVAVKTCAKALTDLWQLLEILSAKVKAPGLRWDIAPDSHRGAEYTALGTGDPDKVEAVVHMYYSAGAAMFKGEPIECDEAISSALAALIDIADPDVERITLNALGQDWEIQPKRVVFKTPNKPDRPKGTKRGEKWSPVLDAVRGMLHTISNRDGIEVYLWDTIFDMRVRCHLRPEDELKAAQHWTKPVIITGLVGRDRVSGRPRTITEIIDIKELPAEENPEWRRALPEVAKFIPIQSK